MNSRPTTAPLPVAPHRASPLAPAAKRLPDLPLNLNLNLNPNLALHSKPNRRPKIKIKIMIMVMGKSTSRTSPAGKRNASAPGAKTNFLCPNYPFLPARADTA